MTSRFNRTLSLLIFLSLAGAGASEAWSAERTPNVVLIFADDLGYGDLGCYGATKVQTPNIDKLAAEGRRFTDAHSVSAVCTPSRYALLTGEYPVRGNGGKGIWGPAPVTSPLLVDPDKTTIADLFKNCGYAAAAFGKWHLGFKTGSNDWQEPLSPGPQDLGFDSYFGVPVVNSAPPYVFVENERIVGGDPDDPLVHLGRNKKDEVTAITEIPPEAAQRSPNQFGGAVEAHRRYNDYEVGTTLANKSVEWIGSHQDKPFFLYLATTNIHHPFTPAKQFQGTSQCGLYGDYIHELDWIVGEILTCLDENGLTDDTLVVFTSDNGGMFNHGGQAAFEAGHRQNGDLLGFKFGVWEGGHRVPFIVRWPGKVKSGTVSDQLFGNVDMLATFAALTDQQLDSKQQADSVNMLPALLGETEETLRDHLILAPHKGTHLSVRKGKWIYIPNQGSGGFNGKKPGDHTFGGPPAVHFVGSVNSDIEDGKIRKDAPPAQLYNLEDDRSQTQNVINEHPELVEELRVLLSRYAPAQDEKASKQNSKKAASHAAPKTPASPSGRSATFDFESGELAPWKVIEGSFGNVVGQRETFFHNGQEYNKQGQYYLTTLEHSPEAVKGSDSQTGVIVSPLFIPTGKKMTFRIGGGRGDETYAALCKADGDEEVLIARGINSQVMQGAEWDLTPYLGQKMYIRIVDHSTTGWGHLTVDDFQFDANVLPEYPQHLIAP
ncbi:Arylsulfatase [Thalassoglobus neptunius]|uniref:Arylsulfatase n=1 Tax=Thalassoglobus neptunius TaxID=1938619 RepID=A0A5C5X6T5_9PLAN|nr:arylsulfatase [Thalassoglobus neptunius]TWT58614.1 Arylsulfatase [Thalassoglobus neptunius]